MERQSWSAPAGDVIPNNPSLPVLLYRGVDAAGAGDVPPNTPSPPVLLYRGGAAAPAGADAAREHFAANGWGGSWVGGVLDFHHFHSTSHEVLAVLAGTATVELGGPQGRAFDVSAGDVVVLPAGTGHRRASASGDFRVLGAY